MHFYFCFRQLFFLEQLKIFLVKNKSCFHLFHFLDFICCVLCRPEFLSGVCSVCVCVCVCSSAGLLAINSLSVGLRKFLFDSLKKKTKQILDLR